MMNATILLLLYAGMIYFIPANLIYVLLLVAGVGDIRRNRKQRSESETSSLPPISIVAPAFNMEKSILPSVAGLLSVDYPDFEIIVINDGSIDRTLELLKEEYALEPVVLPDGKPLCKGRVHGLYRSAINPRLRVIDKDNGGAKADALNAGISYVRHDLFCAVDSDSLLEADALRQLVRPFVRQPGRAIAAGGAVRVINGSRFQGNHIEEARVSKNPFVLFQVVEYIRAFYTGRTGWSRFNALLIISGAFGMFRTDAVKAVGGYASTAIGEDMELVTRLHHEFRRRKIKYSMSYVPEAVCWTEVPSTLHSLYVQRHRWQRGLLDSLVAHGSMLFNPRFGALGFLAFPYFVFVEAFGPLIEVFLWGVLFLAHSRGMLSFGFWLAFVLISLAFGWALSMCSLCVEVIYFYRYTRVRDFLLMTSATVLEPFGYRQLTAVWRLAGTFSFLRGNKHWGQFKRKGFGQGIPLAGRLKNKEKT